MSEPRERADKVRAALIRARPSGAICIDGIPPNEWLPPGSLVLTADEAEAVRESLWWLIQHGGRATKNYKHAPAPAQALALLSPEANVEDTK